MIRKETAVVKVDAAQPGPQPSINGRGRQSSQGGRPVQIMIKNDREEEKGTKQEDIGRAIPNSYLNDQNVQGKA